MLDEKLYEGILPDSLHCFFNEKYQYVEEFDTEDGTHRMVKVEVKDWTPEIFEEAIRCGFVDECLKEW